MQKKKLPVGLVVAFAVLVLIGIFANANNTLKTAGLDMGKKPEAPTELKGKQLSEGEMKAQRDAMLQARASRQGDQETVANANPEKPTLLIMPEIGNHKQSFNESQTAAQWYREDSYIEEKTRKAKNQRGDKK